MYLLIANMTVDYIRISASNRKQLERLLAKRKENIGMLFALLVVVAVLGLAGLILLF